VSQFQVNLQDHVAIVTGAGGDVGKAIAHALANAGASVCVNDMNPDRAASVAAEIQNQSGTAFDFQGDVSNRYQVAAMIEETRSQFSKVTLLVNAAGGYKADPLLKFDEWDWRKQLDVLLTGTLFCTQLVGRVMTDEGGGVIVNVASSAAHRTLEGGAVYVAAKAGVIALTRQSARELAPGQIRVNAVCPGNLADDYTSPPPQPNMLGRAGTFDEVADVVLFLVSDAARFITGQAIDVDGGSL
jgi:NAD(P)-dependent dehydrogenase (short-subunit alcohol dehydrogenase family)